MLLAVVACGSDSQRSAVHPEIPAGLMPVLMDHFEQAIDEGGRREASEQVPDAHGSRITDLGYAEEEAGDRFAWTYANPGDYNQDGLVAVNDITPVGAYFSETEGGDRWAKARVADGNQDGAITIADITTIGHNWQNRITGYHLETAAEKGAAKWDTAWEVTLADGAIPAEGGFRRYEVVIETPLDGNWYRVTPYLGETAGLAGDAVQYIAPEPNLTWAHTVGTWDWDVPGGLAVDSEGNIYTAGSLHCLNIKQNEEACLIAKWSQEGELLWARAGRTGFRDEMYELFLTDSGDLIGLANLYDDQESRTHYVLIRVSGSGDLVWSKAITCSPNLSNVQLSALPGGDLLLSGTALLDGWEECGIMAAQLSPSCTPCWQRAIILPAADYAACTKLVADGRGSLWTGVTTYYTIGEPKCEMAIVKLSSTGELELARICDTAGISDYGDEMSWYNAFGGTPTGVYLVGRISVYGYQLNTIVVMRVGDDGMVTWTREYSSQFVDEHHSEWICPYEVVHTLDGNSLLTGTCFYMNYDSGVFYHEELFVPLSGDTGMPLADANAYRAFDQSYGGGRRPAYTKVTPDALVHLTIAKAATGYWGTQQVDSNELTVIEFSDMPYRLESSSLELTDFNIDWGEAEVVLDTVEQIQEEPSVQYDGVDMLLISKKID